MSKIKKISSNWKENEAYIIQEYLDGRTQPSIAEEFRFATNTTIRRILIKHNIPFRDCGEYRRLVKCNIFSNLNDPSVQYWLGYIAADGCIHSSNVIEISTNLDPQHLQKYINWAAYPLKITSYKDKRYNDIYGHRVSFSNSETAEFLISLGLTPKKSLTLDIKFPLTWDFIRGVFDGDGCISEINKRTGPIKRARFQIATGSASFKTQLVQFFEQEGITSKCQIRTSGKNPLHLINIYRIKDIELIYNKFYSNASYYLERKYKKFGAFIRESDKVDITNSGNDSMSNPELADNIEPRLDDVVGQV